jgi:hypothetical protein
MDLRQFWIWTDGKEVSHASAFKPTVQASATVYAANARDALAPLQGGRRPRHNVVDADNGDRRWSGRCEDDVAAKAAS